MVKVLHLTLKKKWFDLIKSGEKKIEYREVKPYWKKRIADKSFDLIHFRNGYSKSSPAMLVEYNGYDFCIYEGKKHYRIKLGKIVKIF